MLIKMMCVWSLILIISHFSFAQNEKQMTPEGESNGSL